MTTCDKVTPLTRRTCVVSAGVHVGLLLGFLSVAYVDWKRAVGWLLWVAAYI